MKIAQVSKADLYGGGASRVAGELTEGLRRAGYSADHICSWAGQGFHDPRISLYGTHERAIRTAHSLLKKMGFPEVFPLELPLMLRRGYLKKYDLFHFHDLSSAIAPATLHYLSARKPVVWTIHDYSPFTAGCNYPVDGCHKFKSGCKACPHVGTFPIDSKIDFSRMWYSIKKRIHAADRMTLLAPSQWMADMAYSSGLLKTKPRVLPNGVNTNIFKPCDRDAVRDKLGIPKDRLVIVLSAGHILYERKGTLYALRALMQLNSTLKPFLLLVGASDLNAKGVLAPFDYKETGYISDPAQLAEAYGAADVFLMTSLAENMPLVMLETMAVATPAIGFAVGGVPEMVIQGETGFLVPPRDVSALADAIATHANKDTLQKWGAAARQRAVSTYDDDIFVQNHLNLYSELISQPYAQAV